MNFLTYTVFPQLQPRGHIFQNGFSAEVLFKRENFTLHQMKKTFLTGAILVFERGEVLFKSGVVTAWIRLDITNEIFYNIKSTRCFLIQVGKQNYVIWKIFVTLF